MTDQPWAQGWKRCQAACDQPVEPLCRAAFAEQMERVFQRFHLDAIGYQVAPQLAVIDLSPCQPVALVSGLKLLYPAAHRLEARAQILAARLFQPQLQREERVLAFQSGT